jgi:hypothetical protein
MKCTCGKMSFVLPVLAGMAQERMPYDIPRRVLDAWANSPGLCDACEYTAKRLGEAIQHAARISDTMERIADAMERELRE